MKHFNDWLKVNKEWFDDDNEMGSMFGHPDNYPAGDVRNHSTSKKNSWFEGQYKVIPDDMKDSIIRYIEYGANPGSFLTAVITNNLRNAVGYADESNLPLIKIYVQWFYNVAPSESHGDVETMKSWMMKQKRQINDPNRRSAIDFDWRKG